MKFLFIVCLNTICAVSIAQKNYADLHLVYPLKLTYNTILIKNNHSSNILLEESKSIKNGWMSKTYKVDMDSIGQSLFSIYFGGSLLNVNDTLDFIGHGKNLLLKIKDSFALKNQINLNLKNVYNFDDLYNRYSKYLDINEQKYNDEPVKQNSSISYSISNSFIFKRQYLSRAGMNFIKENINNPYSAVLFGVFVITPSSYADYDEAYTFYINNLKNNINNPQIKAFVENKIELLKQNAVTEGSKVPFFAERSIQNRIINIDSLSGKNVLLMFWATWCVPCMAEMPYIQQINEKYKNDNLVMIGVSLDADSAKMISVINKNGMNWIHIFNNKSLLEKFRINPIPDLFLIDEKGIIML